MRVRDFFSALGLPGAGDNLILQAGTASVLEHLPNWLLSVSPDSEASAGIRMGIQVNDESRNAGGKCC